MAERHRRIDSRSVLPPAPPRHSRSIVIREECGGNRKQGCGPRGPTEKKECRHAGVLACRGLGQFLPSSPPTLSRSADRSPIVPTRTARPGRVAPLQRFRHSGHQACHSVSGIFSNSAGVHCEVRLAVFSRTAFTISGVTSPALLPHSGDCRMKVSTLAI